MSIYVSFLFFPMFMIYVSFCLIYMIWFIYDDFVNQPLRSINIDQSINQKPKYYRTKCNTMSQLLNANGWKWLNKVAKCVHLGMKECTSLPNVVSEDIDAAGLNCLYT